MRRCAPARHGRVEPDLTAPRRAAGARAAPAAGAVLAAACVAALLAAPVGATGQEPLAFELRGGFGLPAFDLADRADGGPAIGLDLSYRVADRVSVVAGGDLELLDGGDAAAGVASDLNVWHYGAGLEAQLLQPRRTYWRLSLGAGLGGTTFDVADGGGSQSDLATYGSLELGRNVSREADLFVGVKSWLAFAGGDGPVAGPPDADALWSFPVTAGVRLHF